MELETLMEKAEYDVEAWLESEYDSLAQLPDWQVNAMYELLLGANFVTWKQAHQLGMLKSIIEGRKETNE